MFCEVSVEVYEKWKLLPNLDLFNRAATAQDHWACGDDHLSPQSFVIFGLWQCLQDQIDPDIWKTKLL